MRRIWPPCDNHGTLFSDIFGRSGRLCPRADYIIDLGPEGGPGGGRIVASGTPEEVARVEGSYTGQFLREILP